MPTVGHEVYDEINTLDSLDPREIVAVMVENTFLIREKFGNKAQIKR